MNQHDEAVIDLEYRNGSWEPPKPPSRVPWTNIILFIVTLITTTVAGTMNKGYLPLPLSNLTHGLSFSLSLITILLCHEFGHFISAKRHKVDATLPYFIPGPTEIGTFGAVIKMKSPVKTRSALVEIGAMGPLAGFLVSMPFLVYGITHSALLPIPDQATLLGDSIIVKLIGFIFWGPMPYGFDLVLHPAAFAAWIGLFVTAMNLIPIGQLDGGHILYAMFPQRFKLLSRLSFAVLLYLGFTRWPGWFVWAILLLIMGLKHPPVETYAPLSKGQRIMGYASMFVFFITFVPVPFSL